MANKGFTLWFTGLSGAGKTTLAKRVQRILITRGMNVELLDGDVVRTNLSKGLGFSKEDRDTNIRRIGFVASLLARNNTVCIAAAISPYTEIRNEVRGLHQDFLEVYTHASIEELTNRDVKGLYKKALAGEIKGFTGVDDPYEAPENAEISINSETESVEESTDKIIRHLEIQGLIPAAPGEDIPPAEEEAILQRLKKLQFIE
ncbi:MAG: adenylyl-sulfate kinase [Planctomycetota bacterium]|jgi:adenylyl-sulfate kinase